MTSWFSSPLRTKTTTTSTNNGANDENEAKQNGSASGGDGGSSTILKSFDATKKDPNDNNSNRLDGVAQQQAAATGSSIGAASSLDDNSGNLPSTTNNSTIPSMTLDQMKERINQWHQLYGLDDTQVSKDLDEKKTQEEQKEKEATESTTKDISASSIIAEIDPTVTLHVMNHCMDDLKLMTTALLVLRHFLEPPDTAAGMSTSSLSFDSANDDNKVKDVNFIILINSIEKIMKSHLENASKDSLNLQAICISCLSLIAQYYASSDMKNDVLLPITVSLVVRQIMTKYVIESSNIQLHSCSLLRYLSNPLLQELVAAGCVLPILNSMKYHPYNPRIQEHGNATLYNLLTICLSNAMEVGATDNHNVTNISSSNNCCCIIVDGMIMTTTNIASIIVEGMMENKLDLQVQKYGLLVLTRLLTLPSQLSTSKANDKYILTVMEQILNNGNGLNVILKALAMSTTAGNPVSTPTKAKADAWGALSSATTADDIDIRNTKEEITQIACSLLKNISRQSSNIQKLLLTNDGITVILNVMRTLSDGNVNIHDPIMATIRNLCSVASVPSPATTTSTTTTAGTAAGAADDEDDINRIINRIMLENGGISCILATMTIHHKDAAIQAYGCDALGRLLLLANQANANLTASSARGKTSTDIISAIATPPTPIYSLHKTIYVENGINIALSAMIEHRTHSGVQDRAIMYLLQLSYYEPALRSMKTKKLKTTITEKTMGVLSTTKYITIQFVEFLQETTLPSNKQLAKERLKKLILKISS